MTPRSRKPVMVLTTTTSSTDQNQTINQTTDMSDFPEHEEEEGVDAEEDDEDEEICGVEDDSILEVVHSKTIPLELHNNPPHPEVINEDATSLGGFSDIFKRQQLLQGDHSFVMQQKNCDHGGSEDSSSNTNDSYKPKTSGEEQQADVLSAHFK